ncbi:histidine phosphatase family protein [Stella sp.]|uniref:histidine phosphatase family protein n=1 Tax=Stella sp. TaxID=2912054 RepID=UPI0035AE63AB
MTEIRTILLALAALATLLAASAARASPDAAWAALADGSGIALVRHATAPGAGDPPGFRLDDCTTQRNLSDAGRAEARRLGAAFRQRGIAVGRVLSSRWCRSLETARLAFGDAVAPEPALDSFFADRSAGDARTAAARRLIAGRSPGRPLVMVTHHVNIIALAGIAPQSGEMIVVRPDGDRLAVVGRVPPAALDGAS